MPPHITTGIVIPMIMLAIASGLGSGFSPKAPGTVGSFVAISLWALLKYLGLLPMPLCDLGLAVAVSIIGLVAANSCIRTKPVGDESDNRHKHEKDDPQYIVIDEWAGIAITLIGSTPTFLHLLLGFFLFRFFDILKPGPVRWAEKLPRGWGVMADDIVAGLFALAILQSLERFFSI